jgi:hypothetical protein
MLVDTGFSSLTLFCSFYLAGYDHCVSAYVYLSICSIIFTDTSMDVMRYYTFPMRLQREA